MLRAIREIQPDWVVGENVPGLINWSKGLVFEEVQADLEAEGYEVIPFILPACAVDAPHRRDRVWFIAHSLYSRNGQPREGNRQYEQGINIKKQGGGSQHSEQFNQYGDNGSSSNTIDTRTNIRLRYNGERQTKDERWEGQSQSELRTGSGTSPDTQSSRDRGELRGLAEEDEGKRQPEECRQDNVQYRDDGSIGASADTEGNSGTGQLNQGQWKGQFRGCDSQIIADTCNKGLERGEINRSIGGIGTERDKQFARCFRPNWQNFPTVSPLCGGDDGLPDNLVGITFPKWRNESIKAMGNAIVPQVALQIFKAIEQYERLNP